MMNDNLLANKLNSFKSGDKNILDMQAQTVSGIVLFSKGILTIIRSIIFGYSIKTIFQTDWNFWQYLFIGYTFTYIFGSILKLFNKEQ